MDIVERMGSVTYVHLNPKAYTHWIVAYVIYDIDRGRKLNFRTLWRGWECSFVKRLPVQIAISIFINRPSTIYITVYVELLECWFIKP